MIIVFTLVKHCQYNRSLFRNLLLQSQFCKTFITNLLLNGLQWNSFMAASVFYDFIASGPLWVVIRAFNFGVSSRLHLEEALLLSFPYRKYGWTCLSVAFHCFYISNVSDIFVWWWCLCCERPKCTVLQETIEQYEIAVWGNDLRSK